jgi:hypothetical protein
MAFIRESNPEEENDVSSEEYHGLASGFKWILFH